MLPLLDRDPLALDLAERSPKGQNDIASLSAYRKDDLPAIALPAVTRIAEDGEGYGAGVACKVKLIRYGLGAPTHQCVDVLARRHRYQGHDEFGQRVIGCMRGNKGKDRIASLELDR